MSELIANIDLRAPGNDCGHLFLPISSNVSAYRQFPSPIWKIRDGIGPTALLMAGVHGDEPEGPIILSRVYHRISTAEVSGTLIFLPFANAPAVHDGTRNSPIDGMNLNRVFPGDTMGSLTSRIASFIEHKLIKNADFVIDLHSGGTSLRYTPVLQVAPEPDAKLRSVRDAYAEAIGLPFTIEMDLLGEQRTVQAASARNSAFWFGAELGGGAEINQDVVSTVECGLVSFLQKVGIVAAQSDELVCDQKPVSVRHLKMRGLDDYVFAPKPGLLVHHVKLGSKVTKGQVIASLFPLDQFDKKSIALESPSSGFVVCQRTTSLTHIGDCVAHLAGD